MMAFNSATRVRHAVLLLLLVILVSVSDPASATAASLCGTPPPNVDGIYTTDIELTESMESSLKNRDGRDIVIAGVLEGGSLDEKPFLVGPGEYSSLYSFALNASAADPLLVEMSVVFPCTPDPDFRTGCVDGFTYADDQRPRSCVWAVNGPCAWRLHCADEDDVSFKSIHVIQQNEDGSARSIMLYNIETGPAALLADGIPNPYQARHGTVGFAALGRVGAGAGTPSSKAGKWGYPPPGCWSKPPTLEPEYQVVAFNDMSSRFGVGTPIPAPNSTDEGLQVRFEGTDSPFIIVFQAFNDEGPTSCVWKPAGLCLFQLECVDADATRWFSFTPVQVTADGTVTRASLGIVQAGPSAFLIANETTGEASLNTYRNEGSIAAYGAIASVTDDANTGEFVWSGLDLSDCVPNSWGVGPVPPELAGRFEAESVTSQLPPTADVYDDTPNFPDLVITSTSNTHLYQVALGVPERVSQQVKSCVYTYQSCSVWTLVCSDNDDYGILELVATNVTDDGIAQTLWYSYTESGPKNMLIMTRDGDVVDPFQAPKVGTGIFHRISD